MQVFLDQDLGQFFLRADGRELGIRVSDNRLKQEEFVFLVDFYYDINQAIIVNPVQEDAQAIAAKQSAPDYLPTDLGLDTKVFADLVKAYTNSSKEVEASQLLKAINKVLEQTRTLKNTEKEAQ